MVYYISLDLIMTNNIHNYIKESMCFVLLILSKLILQSHNRIIVFGYHSVSNDDTCVDIPPENFIAQVNYLKKQNYDFISLQDAYDYVCGHKEITRPSVVFTFDDGYEDLLSNALPLLSENQIYSTIFVMSDPLHVDREYLENDKKLISTKTLPNLPKFKGSDIQAHTTSHQPLYLLPKIEIYKDVLESKKKLESLMQTKISFFAYPWGRFNDSYSSSKGKPL